MEWKQLRQRQETGSRLLVPKYRCCLDMLIAPSSYIKVAAAALTNEQ